MTIFLVNNMGKILAVMAMRASTTPIVSRLGLLAPPLQSHITPMPKPGSIRMARIVRISFLLGFSLNLHDKYSQDRGNLRILPIRSSNAVSFRN